MVASGQFGQFRLQDADRLHAGRPKLDLPILENDRGGHGPDVELLANLLVVVYIDFDESEIVAQVGLELAEDGAVGFTGAAPGGEKVDEDGRIAVDEVAERGGLFFSHFFKAFSV